MGREGENRKEERKQRVSLKEVSICLILTDGLHKHMGIFGYHEWPYQHRDILDTANSLIGVRIFFGECLSSLIILALHLLLE